MCLILLLCWNPHNFIKYTQQGTLSFFLSFFPRALTWALGKQVKFASHLREPDLSSGFTNWSHLLQQCFEVYLHYGCQVLPFPLPFFLTSSCTHSLTPFFPYALSSLVFFLSSLWLSLLFLTPDLSLYPFIIFFNSSIHSLFSFFHIWAENWPKWMRSWRAVSTVIM